MADDGKENTSKFLMAWYVLFAPGNAAQQIRIGDDRSFNDALVFGAWCVATAFGIATVIAGAIGAKEDSDATAFLWREVAFVAVAGNWLILYPALRLIGGKAISPKSAVHICCYYLLFGVLKLAAYYVGLHIPLVLLLVWPIDIWGLVVLAFLFKRLLKLAYWKFFCAFVITVLVIGVGWAVFAPASLKSMFS